MGLKNLLMKKMLQAQMKDVPKEQQEMILTMVEKNPQLFEQIAKEMQEEMKKGVDQMTAAMTVMSRHKEALQKLQS